MKIQSKNYWSTLSEEERKTWSTFMINRYLSMDYNLIEIVDIFQKYTPQLSNEMVYRLYAGIVPKSNKFLRYIKRDSKDKIDKDNIEKISIYYGCSLSEAEQYCEILTKEEIKQITKMFGG